ncbi:MAG: ATP-binding protein [Anaerorhabdus sp.]
MKKAKFDIKKFDIIDEDKLIEKLKNDKQLQALLKERNISESLIDTFPHKISKWFNNLNKCSNCKGLNYCTQDVCGQFIEIEYDGFWIENVKFCKYKQSEEDKYSHKKNYLICDLSKSQLLLGVSVTSASEEFTKMFKFFKKNENDFKGLYIFGSVGVGKTYSAAYVSNMKANDGKKVSFVNVPELVNRVKQNFGNSEEIKKEINKIKRSEFVVFDDIGAEHVSEWTRDELLFPILDYRLNNKKTTWFTSNLPLDILSKHYSQVSDDKRDIKALRILERIRALSIEFEFEGINERNKS